MHNLFELSEWIFVEITIQLLLFLSSPELDIKTFTTNMTYQAINHTLMKYRARVKTQSDNKRRVTKLERNAQYI